MKYVLKFKILVKEQDYGTIEHILQRYGFNPPHWTDLIEIEVEKNDPRRPLILRDLARALGHEPFFDYEPVFGPAEVEGSRLLKLTIRNLCGRGFREWSEELRLPPGTRVVDKREIRKKDIANTFAFEVIVSERLRELLADSNLSGWKVYPVQHINPNASGFPPCYQLLAVNVLPPLSRMTDLEEIRHREPEQFLSNRPSNAPDPLHGTIGLFLRGPLTYRTMDLNRVEDFNHTSELFGEGPQKHPYLVISNIAWQFFRENGVQGVDVEPVVIE